MSASMYSWLSKEGKIHAVNVPYLSASTCRSTENDYLPIRNCQTTYLIKFYLYRLFVLYFYGTFFLLLFDTAFVRSEFTPHVRIENRWESSGPAYVRRTFPKIVKFLESMKLTESIKVLILVMTILEFFMRKFPVQ